MNSSVGASTGWVNWYPTSTVQEWYNGTSAPGEQGAAEYGLMVKDASEGAANNDLTFDTEDGGEDTPTFTFEWTYNGAGPKSQFTNLPIPLTDKMSLAVNAASGNLAIQNNDLEIAGRGLNFSAARTWNSFDSEYLEQYGDGWMGNAIFLGVWEGGSSIEFEDGGASFIFIKDGSKYRAPPGLRP